MILDVETLQVKAVLLPLDMLSWQCILKLAMPSSSRPVSGLAASWTGHYNGTVFIYRISSLSDIVTEADCARSCTNNAIFRVLS